MKITDIIRTVIDIIDHAEQQEQPATNLTIELPLDGAETCPTCHADPCECGNNDELGIIQQLAGLEVVSEPEYQNAPNEVVASIGASYPGGDDMHQRKNPADIRTNAPSMYPGYQAEKR